MHSEAYYAYASKEFIFTWSCRNNGGGGVISIVMRGIGHASFSDAEYLFGKLLPKTMLSVRPLIETSVHDVHRWAQKQGVHLSMEYVVNENGSQIAQVQYLIKWFN